jgi:hypothetical protein
MDNCPQGIKNEKDVQRLEERFMLMLDQVKASLDELNKKIDCLDRKFEDFKRNMPVQIDKAVDTKWRTGVYGIVKWLIITGFGAAIVYIVRNAFGG